MLTSAGRRGKVIGRACKHFRRGDIEAFYEKLAVASFRQSPVSISLAKPDLPDCPLIGISVGFEQLTGYSVPEALGKNCRFLNRGCPMRADVRQELRLAVRTHQPVICVLSNRRRNGELFRNLVHMSSLRIGRNRYIVAVQQEVHTEEEENNPAGHTEELNRVVDRILATVMEAWAELEPTLIHQAQLTRLIPSAEMARDAGREGFTYHDRSMNSFVSLAPFDPLTLSTTKTFVEVRHESFRPGELLSQLRRASSEPALGGLGEAGDDAGRVPIAALRDALDHISRPHTARRDFLEVPRPSAGTEGEDAPTEDPRSIGSALHPHGCKPCSFYCYSLMGCIKGMACPYCHMDHPRCSRRRKKKGGAAPADYSPTSSSGAAVERDACDWKTEIKQAHSQNAAKSASD